MFRLSRPLWLATLLLSSTLLSSGAAQLVPQPAGDLAFNYAFSMQPPQGAVDVPATGSTLATIQFKDSSTDGPTSRTGNPGTSQPLIAHFTHFSFDPVNDRGWNIQATQPTIQTYAGQTVPVNFLASVIIESDTPRFFETHVIATTRVTGPGVDYTYVSNASLTFSSTGPAGFQIEADGGFNQPLQSLHPRQLLQARFTIRNFESAQRTFAMAITYNPCDLGVTAPPTIAMAPHSQQVVEFTVEGPTNGFWYRTEGCSFGLSATPTDGGSARSTSINVVATGFNLDPYLIFLLLVALAILYAVILLIRRAKDRADEELLGKPQKPWLIPTEAVYLQRLRETDYRSWYTVRHFLMEDEYKSALLWYAAYKAATKGTRQKERLVLKQEKAYDRWKAKWEARIEEPMVEADKYEAKLQRKLDRKARKRHRKELRHAAKVRAELKDAQAKRAKREADAWEKAAAKAQKKGLPVPPRPQVPAPEAVPDPPLTPIPLASHRWAKRAKRWRAKCVRRVGDLEVKFEKADAKMLRRVRRKVAKLGRKLDDPDFVADHPLLRSVPKQT